MNASRFGWWRRGLTAALTVSLFCLSRDPGRAADEVRRFSSPQAAVDELRAAVETRDTNALRAIFGPAAHALVSVDVVEAAAERELFVRRVHEKVTLVAPSDSRQELQLGADGWPFPIPLVKTDGQWSFDVAAGSEEILNRRIGANELGAMRVCRTYVQAQREYASVDRNGDGLLQFAQHLRSTPGSHDGLYWSTRTGDPPSPLGPLVAQARVEGYRKANRILTDEQVPYHGYYFKVLTRQGQHASGGKFNYLVRGRLMAGFALVAWPAEWGNTGIMTFIVNQQGQVFEKNLGPKTAKRANALTAFDPDPTWAPAKEP